MLQRFAVHITLGGIKRSSAVKTLSLDVSLSQTSKLKSEKITTNDLLLIDQFRIKDWNGKEFDQDLLLKYGEWIANEDRSVIFKGLGGGAFEIPEMYDLIYKGAKVHLWCGGGGDTAATFVRHADGCFDVTVFASQIHIPPELSHEQESVLALLVEAFAVRYFGPLGSGKLTVQFNL